MLLKALEWDTYCTQPNLSKNHLSKNNCDRNIVFVILSLYLGIRFVDSTQENLPKIHDFE